MMLFFALGPLLGASERKEIGAWIEHGDGWLNLLVEENRFQLHFLDENKEPVKPDAVRAVVHYSSRTVREQQTTALLPVEPKEDEEVYFTSPRFIRPPFHYQVLLVLMFDEAGTKTKAHSINFQQVAD